MSRQRRFCNCGATAAGALLLTVAALHGQTRWAVDPKASLAWWQMNPHLSHLWATTCPSDPSWQAGEGRTISDAVGHVMRQKTTVTDRDETRIPLYPRRTVRSLCPPAVNGEVTLTDTINWQVRGTIAVTSEFLVTGQSVRDRYGQKTIFDIENHPQIKFVIDSVSNVQRGEPLKMTAFGTFQFRGKSKPMTVPLTVDRHPGGAVRVQGQFSMPAEDLVNVYDVSAYALGLSVGLRVWRTLHMGIDALLRPTASSSGSSPHSLH
jgi:hypothetical protein